MKLLCLSLEPPEWRKLRLWAAEQAGDIEWLVREILRRELDRRPGSDF